VTASLARRATSEVLGTAFLLAVVVGSATLAERLSGGNAGLALLINSLCTGGALIALILAFSPLSGAHFNPVVTVLVARDGGLAWKDAPVYVAAQVLGAVLGIVLAHLMYELPVFTLATQDRSGAATVLSEAVATFGLLAVVKGCGKLERPELVSFAVGGYVMAGYWFTKSGCFANPAVTFSRLFTNTPAGIRLADAPGYFLGEGLGLALALALFTWLTPREAKS
jgi:glycerol uptake facilitator-like aquaporin